MAGIAPFFITGANAKIKLNDKTLAFCTDLSYQVTVRHEAPTLLGMYEPASIEPVGYAVRGTFTIVRYAKDVKKKLGNKAPKDVNEYGNGVGNWGTAWLSSIKGFGKRNGIFSNDGRAHEALDPKTFENATTFDIQVYQKVPNPDNDDINDLMGVANIRGCRIVDSTFSMNKRGVATQRFEFMALYLDEDSFAADFSGNGQQFG